MSYEQVVRAFGFAHELEERALGVDGAARVAEGRLTAIDPASAEYALAVAALVSKGNESVQRNFAILMRFLGEIRPPQTGGRMATKQIPERFKGEWPHQRLGHRTWTDFVTAPIRGEVDGRTREFKKPPGLGWTKDYEGKLHKGYEVIRDLVTRAMPEAPPEAIAARVDEVAQGAGARAVEEIGKVGARPDLDTPAAAQVTESLAAGAVTADDIRERGAEALTAPRPKGERETPIEQVMKKVRRWNPEAIRELIARLEEVLAA